MRSKVVILLAVLLISASCSKVPYTNRRQFKMLPESLLTSMSLTEYSNFLASNPVIPSDHPDSRMITQVGDKLTGAVKVFMENNNLVSRLGNFSWEYHLVLNEEVNAWCMPGGKIVFYTGILPFTKDEAGAAVVMGHEIAHAVANHGNERMSQQLALTMGAIGLDIALSQKPQETRDLFMLTYGVGGTLGTLAYSRQHEYEADKLGMVFLAMAGYHPERAISFWEDMAAIGGTSIPTFMSTHPSSSDRVEAIRQFLPEAMKYYYAATGTGNPEGKPIQSPEKGPAPSTQTKPAAPVVAPVAKPVIPPK